MSAIDPRIAGRRRAVAEHGARRRLRSMIIAVLILGLAGLGYWATQSELLDVDAIAVGPAVHADVEAALAHAGVSEGMPLIVAIRRAGTIEDRLEDNPWVHAATVNVLFPGKIEIAISERSAAAVVATADGGWELVSGDGTILEVLTATRGDLGVIGDRSIVTGGLAFLGVLGDLAPGTELRVVDGEVWVERDTVLARLGRAIDMEAKAAAFAALVIEDVPAGWAINLTAPSRPALFEVGQGSPSSGG